MIFVTDALGKATYVSSEWTDHTGQSLDVARNFGWAEALHPEDREIVRTVVADAITTQSEFSVRYRSIDRDGRYMWMAAGGVASFGPAGLPIVHALVVRLAMTNVRPCIEKAFYKAGLELARLGMSGADTGKLH